MPTWFFAATETELRRVLPGWSLADTEPPPAPAPRGEGIAARLERLPHFGPEQLGWLDEVNLGAEDFGDLFEEEIPTWGGPEGNDDHRIVQRLPRAVIDDLTPDFVDAIAGSMSHQAIDEDDARALLDGLQALVRAMEPDRELHLLSSGGDVDVGSSDLFTVGHRALLEGDPLLLVKAMDEAMSFIGARSQDDFARSAQPVLRFRALARHRLGERWLALSDTLAADALARERPDGRKAPDPGDFLMSRIHRLRREHEREHAEATGLAGVIREELSANPGEAPIEMAWNVILLVRKGMPARAVELAATLLEIPSGQEGVLWLCRGLGPFNERRLLRPARKGSLLEATQRAAQLLPESAHAHYMLAWALADEVRKDEARAALAVAERLMPESDERMPDAWLAPWLGAFHAACRPDDVEALRKKLGAGPAR